MTAATTAEASPSFAHSRTYPYVRFLMGSKATAQAMQFGVLGFDVGASIIAVTAMRACEPRFVQTSSAHAARSRLHDCGRTRRSREKPCEGEAGAYAT